MLKNFRFWDINKQGHPYASYPPVPEITAIPASRMTTHELHTERRELRRHTIIITLKYSEPSSLFYCISRGATY